MNITSVQYIANEFGEGNVSYKAVIDGKEYIVPINGSNYLCQAVNKWIAEGNTPAPAE